VFEVHFKKSVEKDLRVFPKNDQRKVLEQIGKALAKDPYLGKALSGEFKGLYRWRTGQFRVIYEIQKDVLLILVLKIGHRKDVYR
jgi:mRNA interferase RelE/StbE